MTRAEFKKIKALIRRLEQQALKEGINLISREFEDILDAFLKRQGVTLQEFYVAEASFESGLEQLFKRNKESKKES